MTPLPHLDHAAIDMDGRRWSDLPADVLREISSRVYTAADFVYFHAVCKQWRASRDPLSRMTTTTLFRPCLLASVHKESTHLRFRCIFSKSTYQTTWSPPPAGREGHNLVSSADGTEVWYLTVKHHRPTLHDPLTGEITPLPLFPSDMYFHRWDNDNHQGIIYSDGTTLLYNLWYIGDYDDNARFKAILLRPGGTKWTVVRRTLVAPRYHNICVAYYKGKIMLTVEATFWRVVLMPYGGDAKDVLVHRPTGGWDFYSPRYSYIVESRGELLWVSVQVLFGHGGRLNTEGQGLEQIISISLYVLKEEETKMWVKRDLCSLADRVLFLGTPNSFVVDSSRFTGNDNEGGCAYFIYYSNGPTLCKEGRVFKCNLISNKVEFVEGLPQGWNDGRFLWHFRQLPYIAPIQELIKARQRKQQEMQQTALLASPSRTIIMGYTK